MKKISCHPTVDKEYTIGYMKNLNGDGFATYIWVLRNRPTFM